MSSVPAKRQGLLLDIDGVLHVGEEPIEGAIKALEKLRRLTGNVRLVTNTTSRSRRQIAERLSGLGFDVSTEEVITPAALAVSRCRERGHDRVHLMVADALREDLAELNEVGSDAGSCDAIVLGDLGEGFTAKAMNRAFTLMLEGAELIALQHNRYWRSGEGLVLDVGAWSAALEYAAEREAVVVGKPDARFFGSALDELDAEPADALMVGDDVEADVGGALDAGIPAILVRTGKYREEAVAASGVEPTATIGSIAELPGLFEESA